MTEDLAQHLPAPLRGGVVTEDLAQPLPRPSKGGVVTETSRNLSPPL